MNAPIQENPAAAFEQNVRALVNIAQQKGVGKIIVLAVLEAIKLDVHASMREQSKAERPNIMRAGFIPPVNGHG